jgi:hypothetical protein
MSNRPAFYELLNEIKMEYREKLALGEVDLETDTYGCEAKVVARNGNVMSIYEAAADIVPSFMTKNVATVPPTDNNIVDENDCGVKRLRRRRMKGSAGYRKRKSKTQTKQPPLLKGAKMIDKRTAAGKRLLTESTTLSRRELAARAAMARVGATTVSVTDHTTTMAEANDKHCITNVNDEFSEDSSNESEDEYIIQPHHNSCACRSCDWDRLLFVPKTNTK